MVRRSVGRGVRHAAAVYASKGSSALRPVHSTYVGMGGGTDATSVAPRHVCSHRRWQCEPSSRGRSRAPKVTRDHLAVVTRGGDGSSPGRGARGRSRGPSESSEEEEWCAERVRGGGAGSAVGARLPLAFDQVRGFVSREEVVRGWIGCHGARIAGQFGGPAASAAPASAASVGAGASSTVCDDDGSPPSWRRVSSVRGGSQLREDGDRLTDEGLDRRWASIRVARRDHLERAACVRAAEAQAEGERVCRRLEHVRGERRRHRWR